MLAAVLMTVCATTHAQSVLLDEVHTTASATQGVPVEHNIPINLAGNYTITLTDLGALLTVPAPLASVKLGITNGSALVDLTGSAVVNPKILPVPGQVQFTATANTTYVVHVVGTPGTGLGSGQIGIVISDSSGNPIASFSDNLALPTANTASNVAILDDSFTVASSGNYQVALTDLMLPQPLAGMTLLLTAPGSATPVAILPDPNTQALHTVVTLQAGVSYRIFAAAQAASGVSAGLYSAVVSPSPAGDPVFARTLSIGGLTAVGSASLTAGSYVLTASDLMVPAALSQLQVVAVANGQIATALSAAGSNTFNATTGTYLVFALGTVGSSSGAGSTPAAGSYSVILQPSGGSPVLNVARAVTPAGGPLSAYSFDTTVTTAATYSFDLADFSFPSKFTTITAAAVQNGAVLGNPLQAAGSQNVTVAAGPVSLLVFGQPGTSGSLFGVDLSGGGATNPIFQVTQGVGQLFTARQVSVTTAGNYGVTVSDVGFPSSLTTFAVIVTQGTSHLGSIFGGGTISFTANPGNYFVNFIAQPNSTDNAGTYALSAGAAPTVDFRGSASSVTSGGTVQLTWTSQNATGCTASGGWTGNQAASGQVTTATITSATTFTIACSGVGGSTSASVNVSIDAPPPAKSGGGGALSTDVLLFLSVVVLLRLWLLQGHSRQVRR